MAVSDNVTPAMIAQLRRMINEPDDTTYDDDALTTYIAEYPCLDERGEEAYTWDTSTTPPTREDNDDWFAVFDLHAAAADIWEEKAATVADKFNFSADGARFDVSKRYEQYMRQARYHRSRRVPKTMRLHKWPEETGAQSLSWITNKLEWNDADRR